MPDEQIDVIATTISGSIADWAKVDQIIPLFNEFGRTRVALHVADTHRLARELTGRQVTAGTRIVISAGGSGTFNSVLEGCIDSGIPLSEVTLGFLRKGSADLIGKVLGMPDEIRPAVKVFVDSLAHQRTVPCDVIAVSDGRNPDEERHFVGYAGAEIFGYIPHYTESRFIKYYKGILSQLFGDLGPFFVGASLAVLEKSLRTIGRRRVLWDISVDGRMAATNAYQAMIIVNGDLGPDLPFAQSVTLGSGDFHLFALRDIGTRHLPAQFRHAWDASVLDQTQRSGFEHYRVQRSLRLQPRTEDLFSLNVDGATMSCAQWADFRIVDKIRLLSADIDGKTQRGSRQ